MGGSQDPLRRRNRNVAILVISFVFLMLAMAFASVPLYRLFCQKTGYGGTPKIALGECDIIADRVITVRFNADVHRDLPWDFKPLQTEVQVRAGETGLAFYQVKNRTSDPMVGIAIYNVTPDKAAIYFNKIACFCFEEQSIIPKTAIDMPVQFFIDPAIVDDPNLKDVDTITLSYTFFHAKDPKLPSILELPSVRRHR